MSSPAPVGRGGGGGGGGEDISPKLYIAKYVYMEKRLGG